MSILHLCNTFFEWELSGNAPPNLEEALTQFPIFFQLQYLPLVYSNPEDGILVSEKPNNSKRDNFFLIKDRPRFSRLETWGHSKLAKAWADDRGIAYDIPPWDLVKKVNSKAYSFEKSPLPGAKLIHPGDPIPPNTVLKSCFGAAGRGILFSDSPKVKAFCQEQWEMGLPLISEPWVKRNLDFSTQWKLSLRGDIEFLGVTFCKTTLSGAHQSNRVNDRKREEEYAPFIAAQKIKAKSVLKEMADWGYFGEVGFDAMIYDDCQLQPIVEINARKTMGFATLMLQQKHYPDQMVEMAYVPSKQPGLLPSEAGGIRFSRQLIITMYP